MMIQSISFVFGFSAKVSACCRSRMLVLKNPSSPHNTMTANPQTWDCRPIKRRSLLVEDAVTAFKAPDPHFAFRPCPSRQKHGYTKSDNEGFIQVIAATPSEGTAVPSCSYFVPKSRSRTAMLSCWPRPHPVNQRSSTMPQP